MRKNRKKIIVVSVVIAFIIMIPVANATPIMSEIISPFVNSIFSEKVAQNVNSVLSGKAFQNITSIISEEEEQIRSLSEDELEQIAIDWDYNDILRNMDDYVGKIIRIEGPIHRTETNSGDGFRFLVLTNPKQFPIPGKHNYIMVDHTGKRFLNDDRIKVWGTIERTSNLPTLFGAEQLMPVIKAIKVNCIYCPD